MLKKCTILGIAFLVVGGLAFGWLRKQMEAEQASNTAPVAGYSLESDEYLEKYGRWYLLTPEEQNQLVLELDKDRQSKSQDEVTAEQQARLRANLPRLAAGEMNPGDIADILYGSGWEEAVVEYRKQREQEQTAQTVAVVCLSIGGALTGGCFIVWILWSIGRALKGVAERRADRRRTVDAEPPELTDIAHEPDEEDDVEASDCPEQTVAKADVSDAPADGDGGEQEDEEFTPFVVPRSHSDAPSGGGRPSLTTPPQAQTDDGPVAVLLSDAPDTETEWSAQMEWSSGGPESTAVPTPPERKRFTPRPRVLVLGEDPPEFPEEIAAPEPKAAPVESPLKEQADDLQKQIAEFKEVAQSVQQASREQSAPLGNTLKELAQQVSAIREYAASQQNRVEKLQDGYDWTIIRTFCLRVIRCIDNLENRINRLADDNEAAAHLDEVKDELLFALESSGIEQFRPEINSEYRGQEKLAEAVKEKEVTGDSDELGKIAKVIRPGYRYIIDEENCKIVRTAQVKLYG